MLSDEVVAWPFLAADPGAPGGWRSSRVPASDRQGHQYIRALWLPEHLHAGNTHQ